MQRGRRERCFSLKYFTRKGNYSKESTRFFYKQSIFSTRLSVAQLFHELSQT